MYSRETTSAIAERVLPFLGVFGVVFGVGAIVPGFDLFSVGSSSCSVGARWQGERLGLLSMRASRFARSLVRSLGR